MRNCPLCNGVGADLAFPYKTIWNGKEFSYIQCNKCGTTFVDPIPSESDFAVMYAKENYHDVFAGDVDMESYNHSIAKMMRYYKDGKSMLDFGCGVGNFLKAGKQKDFQCYGVEYDPKVIEHAKKNADVPVYSFDKLKSSGLRFDIIHLGDVLEHMAEPKAIMKELSRLLTPNGVFLIEGPLQNNASLIYWFSAGFKAIKRKLGIDIPGNIAPTHLFLTNKIAQKRFFTDILGYKCIHYEIYETGFPFLTRQDNIFFSAFIKQFIGISAVMANKMEIWNNKMLGNRFFGIFQP